MGKSTYRVLKLAFMLLSAEFHKIFESDDYMYICTVHTSRFFRSGQTNSFILVEKKLSKLDALDAMRCHL